MSREVDPSAPSTRWTSSAAWKVCAIAPLAILCTLLLVKAVGGLAGTGGAPEAADVPRAALAEIGQTPRLSKADPTQKPSRKPKPDKTSDAPEVDPTTASSTPDQTHSSTPTRTPSPSDPSTTKPSPSSPSPTPTPEEAREACERAGVNPLDLPAMAACISDAMGDD